MSANKQKKARRTPEHPHGPRKTDAAFFDLDRAASCTECTGLLPAQIETEAQGESISALQGIHTIQPGSVGGHAP